MTTRRMRVALYHPWIYVKSGLERTILEIGRRSRHQWTIYTSHYDRDGTYPELRDFGIIELERVSVRRAYAPVLKVAWHIATTRLDPARHDALLISCEGMGDLMAVRNTARPIVCLCFTPLRAAFDPEYRIRARRRAGALWPLAVALEGGFRVIDRLCWRRYSAVVAISETVRRRIADGGLFRANDITVLYPGVDAARVAPSAVSERYLLIAGRIMWTKNIELGIEAFALARAQLGPDFRLIIAGMVDAKSRGYAEGLMRRAAEVGGVQFVVDPTDAELRALYERCTAVLFTAFNEDWGIVPLEAMAAGKPVVAVNRGGPSETVLHGETGYLEPDIPAAFARRMIELAPDPALCRRLGLAGAERAQQFSWDAFVAGLDMIIEKTARGASSTS